MTTCKPDGAKQVERTKRFSKTTNKKEKPTEKPATQ